MQIGHENIRAFFKNAYQSGVLSHAYCLVGPAGVGKRTLAKEIAAEILTTTVEGLERAPNFLEIRRREDEKTGKLKKEISVKEARELKTRFGMGRWGGKYQVAVIDEAELLNEEAANAILKLLEEPPAGSIIFLLTTDEQVLLPTIRSRVQCIYVQPLSENELAIALKNQGYDEEVIKRVLPFAAGRPGVALKLLREDDSLKIYEQELQRLEKIIGQPFYAKIALVEDLFGDSDDHIRGREKLIETLELWILWWKRQLELRATGAVTSLTSAFTTIRISTIIDNIFWTRQMLRKNIHPRLLIEHLIMNF